MKNRLDPRIKKVLHKDTVHFEWEVAGVRYKTLSEAKKCLSGPRSPEVRLCNMCEKEIASSNPICADCALQLVLLNYDHLTKGNEPMKSHAQVIASMTRLANALSDGHFTVMKFTGGWRVSLSTPGDREDISRMAKGDTLNEAYKALKRNLSRHLFR